jgi:hypothetical protein
LIARGRWFKSLTQAARFVNPKGALLIYTGASVCQHPSMFSATKIQLFTPFKIKASRFQAIPGPRRRPFLGVVFAMAALTANALFSYAFAQSPPKDVRILSQSASEMPLLTHRYSFDKDASDSVGHADGTLCGTANVSNGQVHLDGQRGDYVNLPGGLIVGYPAVTFEFWADLGTNRAWARVFDQGSTNGTRGQHDLYFCPHSASDFRLTIMDPHPTERVVTIRGNLDNRTNLHVACVLDPRSGFMGIYTNGVLANSRGDLASLGSVDTNLFFLGRSLFASDPWLNGSIDEFRIYNGAMSAAAIAANYTNGPNAALSTLPLRQ